jgi:hypothetical protein
MKRLLLLLFLLLPLLAHAQKRLDEQWYTLLLEGRTVGFLHHSTWQISDGLVRSEIEQTMEIRRFGVPFALTQKDVWIEDPGIGFISVSSELDMNGQRQGVEARSLDGGLQVRLRRGEEAAETAEMDEFFLPVEGELPGLYAVDREIAAMIAGWDGKGEANAGHGLLQYELFSTESLKIEEVRLRILGRGEAEDSLGGCHRGVMVEERSSLLPGVITTQIYDEQAVFLYSKTPVGLALEVLRLEGDPSRSGDRQGGSEIPDSGGDGQLAAAFDVASLTVSVQGLQDVPLERAAAVTVAFRGQGVTILRESVRASEEDLGSSWKGSGNAPVGIVSAKLDGRGSLSELVLELKIGSFQAESDQPHPPSPGAEPFPPGLERYLRGGFHLDLTDPRLVELLGRCGIPAGGSEPAAAVEPQRILCLERLVERYIRNKSLAYGFAGLEEVLSKREGDCTEHALLLAALLRRAGIPCRLAYGMILTEGGFIGHAWVELYSGGRWSWLDPSFPGGRPYGLKIRLGVMDPAEPLWASLSLALLQVVATVEAELQGAELR